MITEDLDKYEEELAYIDKELAENNKKYSIDFVKGYWREWDSMAKNYYAKQLHVTVDDLVQRLNRQQEKCTTCGKALRYDKGSVMLTRRDLSKPFNYDNVRFKCYTCCVPNKQSASCAMELDDKYCCMADDIG